MSAFNTDILPPSDRNLIMAFKTFTENIKEKLQQQVKTNIAIGVMPPLEINLAQLDSLEEFKLIIESDVNLVESLQVILPDNQTSINFQRRSTKPTSSLTLSGNNQLFSDVNFNKFLFKLRHSLTSASTLPAEILNTQIKASIEKDLSASTSYLKEDIYALKRQYEKELILERNKLLEDFRSKEETFNKKTEEKETELKLREEEIERISNTDARRKIRLDLNKEIDQKIKEFGPSTSINSSHKNVSRLFYLIIILLIGSSIFFLTLSFNGILSEKDSAKFLILEFAMSLIALIGFFIYFTRWKSNWDNRLLKEEFLLKKYRLDMDRSSWLIESYLEMQMSHKKDLPESLVTPISANLFQSSTEHSEVVLHPLEELVGSLAKNSKLRLKTGKHEIEVEKNQSIN